MNMRPGYVSGGVFKIATLNLLQVTEKARQYHLATVSIMNVPRHAWQGTIRRSRNMPDGYKSKQALAKVRQGFINA
jgi:hypothetical protein